MIVLVALSIRSVIILLVVITLTITRLILLLLIIFILTIIVDIFLFVVTILSAMIVTISMVHHAQHSVNASAVTGQRREQKIAHGMKMMH